MAKISRSQQIFSEIDCLLDAGRYEDAKVLVSFLDRYWSDRESQLALLLINVTLYGPLPYKEEISQLRTMADASGFEKEIIRKIVLQAEKEEVWPNQARSNLLNPPREVHSKKGSFGNNSELLQERNAEIVTLRNQLAELGASKDQAVRFLEEAVKHDTELLRNKDAELDALEDRFALSICSLENQLHEKERLLSSRAEDLKTVESELGRLAAQLADLRDAKDKEGLLLRDQLEQKEELLLLKDAAIKKMQDESLERFRALETQVSKQENLLATRDAEIDRLTAKLGELDQQRAELAAERETSERLLQEHLEQESLERFRILETRLSERENLLVTRDAEINRLMAKISELDQQRAELAAERETSERLVYKHLEEETLERFRTLETRLSEQENLLATRDAEIDGLITEINELNLQRTKLTAERETSERLLQDLRGKAALSQMEQTVANPASSRLTRGDASISGQPNWLRRAYEQLVKTFPQTGLPIGAAALLIIAIGYFLASDRRTAPSYTDVFLSPSEVNAPVAVDGAMEPRKAVVQSNAAKERFERTPVKRVEPTGRVIPYMTRRIVSLRDEPRFGAPVKGQIRAGTPISVLEAQGDWFKIRTPSLGAIGYVRREHLVNQKNLPR